MSALSLVEPHGGVLVDRLVPDADVQAFTAHAATLPTFVLDARELADLELIATGAASPLTGFLDSRDYQSVLDRLRLANGTVWPLPFTLAVPEDTKVAPGDERALADGNGRVWGTIAVTDVFMWKVLRQDLSLDRAAMAEVLTGMISAVIREGRQS